ncbi:MAG: cytochrome c [Gemmatimonadales bacterium]|jgi:mono/diheme cytochrome c family protein
MQTLTIHRQRRIGSLPFLLVLFTAVACGGEGGSAATDEPSLSPEAAAEASAAGISAEEMIYGIGPVRDLDLEDEFDDELVARGQEIFTTKCSACHKLDERYVGPPLGGVTERRKPEYVMNMILNTDEMVTRHPEVKKLLAQYYTPMPDQQLTDEDARAVLEYLRTSSAPTGVDDDADAAATTADDGS